MELEPIIVTFPHSLGKAEAARRVKAGLTEALGRHKAQVKVAEEKWDGDRLTYRAAVLGQTVTGTIDVADDNVKVAATLSWFWGHMVKPAEALIQKEGTQILAGS
jgi:hypothetical protein